jgi:transcriptional regulator with XRE-family HTH domain
MNDDDRDRLLAELLARPTERERILHDAQLNERDRVEIAELVDTADMLWLSAQGAPPLEDDPVAAMLGLIPDAECSLDARALSQARRRVGMTVSQVAERLQGRGWEVQTGDVFRWEQGSTSDVAPAVVEAVADILNVSVESLIASPALGSRQDFLADIRRNSLFEQLVDRWARIRRVSRAAAAAALESRLVATVHRGDRPDPEQLLRSLDVLVSSLEEAGD